MPIVKGAEIDAPGYNSIHVQMHITLFPAIYNLTKQANNALLDETYSLNKVAAQPNLSRDYGAAKRRYDNYVAQGAYDLPPGQKDPAALNARNEYKLLEGMHRQTNPQPYNPNVVANRGINSASYADPGTSYGDMYVDQWRRVGNLPAYAARLVNPDQEEFFPLNYRNNAWLNAGAAANGVGLAAGIAALYPALQAAPGVAYATTAARSVLPFLRSQAIPFYNTGRTLLTNPSSFRLFPNVRDLWNIGRMRAGRGDVVGNVFNALGHTASSLSGLYNWFNAGAQGLDRADYTDNLGEGGKQFARQWLGGLNLNPLGPVESLVSGVGSDLLPERAGRVVGLPLFSDWNPINPPSSSDKLVSERAKAVTNAQQEVADSPRANLLLQIEQELINQGYSADAAHRQAEIALERAALNNMNSFDQPYMHRVMADRIHNPDQPYPVGYLRYIANNLPNPFRVKEEPGNE